MILADAISGAVDSLTGKAAELAPGAAVIVSIALVFTTIRLGQRLLAAAGEDEQDFDEAFSDGVGDALEAGESYGEHEDYERRAENNQSDVEPWEDAVAHHSGWDREDDDD